jgi:hypothetical protein
MSQEWGNFIGRIFENVWSGFINVLLTIIGALLVLIVGLLIASLLGSLVEKIIRLIKLDKFLENLGLKEYVERAGLSLNSGKFFKKLVYWIIVIVFLLAASDILGFYSLSSFLNNVLNYIPNVIVAVLIMLAAFVIAHFLKGLVIASVKASKLHGAGFLGSLTWWSITIFGFLAALSQLGIAVTIINILVTGVIAMLALAFGLAFGLGGKEYAAHIISKLREELEK